MAISWSKCNTILICISVLYLISSLASMRECEYVSYHFIFFTWKKCVRNSGLKDIYIHCNLGKDC